MGDVGSVFVDRDAAYVSLNRPALRFDETNVSQTEGEKMVMDLQRANVPLDDALENASLKVSEWCVDSCMSQTGFFSSFLREQSPCVARLRRAEILWWKKRTWVIPVMTPRATSLDCSERKTRRMEPCLPRCEIVAEKRLNSVKTRPIMTH